MQIYFLMMYLMFIFLLVLSMFMYMIKMDCLIEWLIYDINSTMIEFYILIDWVSCLFIALVLMISSLVIMYSTIYMEGDENIERFFYLVVLFVVSMVMMILSPSMISILFGWDLLGLVSYCLVIYYQNVKSYNSGMITVLSNRIGDVGLLVAIGSMLTYGSWNVYSFNLLEIKFVMFMIFLASITKSAQMPFSSWLPLAMAAPTPVSSLVHSSTLVTAGVYLIMRFNIYIVSSGVNFLLLYMSVITMFLSGLMASFEFDLKKIIALSTLSQLSIMMMIMSLGVKMLGFYHLLTHAVFKSLLFLCAGIVIHFMNNNQDIRYYGNLMSGVSFVGVVFYISLLSLMGIPFLSGFYSKDLIIELMYIFNINFYLMMLFLVSLMLTVMYSLRLYFFFIFGNSMYNSLSFICEDKMMNYSMMMLMVMSVIFGALLNWIFFFDVCIIYLGGVLKVLILALMITSLVGWMGTVMIKVMYIKNLYVYMSMMGMLNYLYKVINCNVFFAGEYLNLLDLEWIESLEGDVFLQVKMSLMKIYYSDFKIFNFILMQMFMVVCVLIVFMF